MKLKLLYYIVIHLKALETNTYAPTLFATIPRLLQKTLAQ